MQYITGWSFFKHIVSSIPPSDYDCHIQEASQPDLLEMSEQATGSWTLQNVQALPTSSKLLLEHGDLLLKFVKLQGRIAEQASQQQADLLNDEVTQLEDVIPLLKDEVTQFEDVIPLLQYKIGETSHRPSSRLDRANQKAADLERTNIELSSRISELQGTAKNDRCQCELLQKKVVELELEKQKQESNTKSLEAKIVQLSDNVGTSQAEADSEHKERVLLQKEHDQLKSDKKTQLQKLESELQLHEHDIKLLKDENVALSKDIIQARKRAKDAFHSAKDAQQDTHVVEDAYIDLEMQKDHDELSKEYGANDAESMAKRFEYTDTIIEDQAAQIHRLEIDLEEMDILQETNQELEEANRKLKDDGQRWKEASQRTAENSQKLEEHIRTLEEANQKLEADNRSSKVNSQTLKQESQQLKAALEKGNQITVSSGVDEATMQWVLRARHETLQLERDLGSLEAAWYGDEAALGHGGEVPNRPVSAPATSVVHGDIPEHDTDSEGFEQSRRLSEIGEPQTMMEAWTRQFASYPPSAGIESWRNSQSQAGTRPGSRLAYGSIYTPSQRSRPASIADISNPLPSARLGLVSRGTDAPPHHPNRGSLQSRRSSISLSRNTMFNAVPTMAELAEKIAKDYFMAYLPHNIEVPFSRIPSPEAPKPPSAAQYQPGMASRDFAVEAAQSSQKSLAFYRHNGVQIMEKSKAPVRPLHRGRKASLSTISEMSGSLFSPRRSESRMRAWLTDDEIGIIRGTGLCERGTQTELEDSTACLTEHDQLDPALVSTPLVFDHSTQTEPLPMVGPDAVATYDRATQTTFEHTPATLKDDYFASAPPAPLYQSIGTQSSLGNVPDAGLDFPALAASETASVHGESQPTQQVGPQAITKLLAQFIEDAATQDVTSAPNADKATVMTREEDTFEHKSVQTEGGVTFSTTEHTMQTDPVTVAELPASTPSTYGYEYNSISRPVPADATSGAPRSRVAATARLFERDNGNSRETRAKLAVLTSGGTQSRASQEPSVTITPTKLFTESPHLAFARTDALARSLRPKSEAKQSDRSEAQAVQQGARSPRITKANATDIEVLPAKVYEQEHRPVSRPALATLDAGVQTSPTKHPSIQTFVSSPFQVAQPCIWSESILDATDISSESTTITWETPDDNPYPTPSFYTSPWRSPVTPDYSGLEVVTRGSFDDGDKMVMTTAEGSSARAGSGSLKVDEFTRSPPEFFSRTAMPSPGEVDSESDQSDEDDSILSTPERRHSGNLTQVEASHEPSSTNVSDTIDSPPWQSASPGPVEAPAHEIITTVKQLTHKSRPSTSPVSPEDAWQLQVVRYAEPSALHSPESRFNEARTEDHQERWALQLQRPQTERPVLRSLMLPHAGTPRLLDSPMIAFPDFDDQFFESPSEYIHSPYLAQQNSRAPELNEVNATNEDPPAQLWQPPHRPLPLDLLRSGSVAETVTPPIDSPYPTDSSQHNKERFRFQALAALEGMAERSDSARDFEAPADDMGFSATSRPNSDRTFAVSSARPSPLRFGDSRFPQPESSDPGVSEIGATSPTTPKSSRLTFFDKPTSSIQQRRHKKAASLPTTAAPVIAGLLEWHPSSPADNTASMPHLQEKTPEAGSDLPKEDAQASPKRDKSISTPTFPGSFGTPQGLDPQDISHLPLPILALLCARLPQLLRDAKNTRWHVTIDWGKLWWTVLWLAMAAYFLFNFWLSVLLRDHIDDWKSANVSSRKYNYIVMARDEYWGNSWWKLLEFWMAGGLGGSMELLV